MLIIEAAKYILGKELMPVTRKDSVVDAGLIAVLDNVGKYSKSAYRTAELSSQSSQFFSIEKDLSQYVDKEFRNDFFFSLKRGLISEGVSAMLLFHLDFIKKSNYSFNELTNIMTEGNLALALMMNSRDMSVEKIIQRNYEPRFKPIEEHRLKVAMGSYYEVIIPQTNRIAFITNDIADKLSDTDIEALEVKGGHIYCRGNQLSKMGGKLGVTRSTYDLRSIL